MPIPRRCIKCYNSVGVYTKEDDRMNLPETFQEKMKVLLKEEYNDYIACLSLIHI